MKLSRIDIIGQNGNDGLHYSDEEMKKFRLDKLANDYKGFIYLTKMEVAELGYNLAMRIRDEEQV